MAAHLEPEILVVDEVLAVGDAEFQKKAIGKMRNLSQGEGRTVLFVSHNMSSVKSLCSRGLLLKNGELSVQGNIDQVLDEYLKTGQTGQLYNSFENFKDRSGNAEVQIKSILIHGETKEDFPKSGKPFNIEFQLENPKGYKISDIQLEFRIDDNLGQRLLWNSSKMKTEDQDFSVSKIIASLEKCILNKGDYYLTVYLKVKNLEADWIQNAFNFVVEEGRFYKTEVEVPSSQSKVLIEFDYNYL